MNDPFTTEPKTRKHVSPWSISGNRIRGFMESLFHKKLKICNYSTVRFEFERYFETNDQRVVEKYIGRPAINKHSLSEEIVRMDRMNGKVARLEYSRTQRLEAKKGLIEILEYATLKDGVFVLHHEKLGYFTKQAVLNSPNDLLESKNDDGVKPSIDDLCACSRSGDSSIAGGRLGELGTVSPPTGERGPIETRVEREESSQHTHKAVITESSTAMHLEPEELAILHAKPTPEPNKAKMDWGTPQ